MASKGFVRTEKDLKLLILYILYHVREALPLDMIVYAATTDPAVEYMPLLQAVAELVENGSIRLLQDEGKQDAYCLSPLGQQSLEACLDEIRPSVRAKAGIAADSAWRRGKHAASVRTSTVAKGDHRFETTMSLMDGEDTLLEVTMLTVSEEQGTLLENNFRRGSDRLYNRILLDLLDDHKEEEEL